MGGARNGSTVTWGRFSLVSAEPGKPACLGCILVRHVGADGSRAEWNSPASPGALQPAGQAAQPSPAGTAEQPGRGHARPLGWPAAVEHSGRLVGWAAAQLPLQTAWRPPGPHLNSAAPAGQLSRARGGRVCRHLPAQLPVPLPRRAKNTTHTNARLHFLCHTPFSPIPFLSFHHRFLLSTLIFLSSRHLDRTDPGIQETPPRRLL